MATLRTHDEDHGHNHVFPKSMYVKTLLALLVLMVATVVVATVPFQSSIVNNVIALTIATIKAVLVIFFFMHVRFSSRLTQLWAAVGFIWLTLIFFILFDYGTRKYEPVPSWEPTPPSATGREIKRPALGDPYDTNIRVRD